MVEARLKATLVARELAGLELAELRWLYSQCATQRRDEGFTAPLGTASGLLWESERSVLDLFEVRSGPMRRTGLDGDLWRTAVSSNSWWTTKEGTYFYQACRRYEDGLPSHEVGETCAERACDPTALGSCVKHVRLRL